MDISALFRIYYPRIFAYLYGSTLDVELSKQLSAAVFHRALEEPEMASRPLGLFEIAHGVLLTAGEQPLDLNDVAAVLTRPARSLVSALRTLPPKAREIVSLRFDAELTETEIAEVTGSERAEVRSTIARVLAMLYARGGGPGR